MHPIIKSLEGSLIVSCQSEEGSPFSTPGCITSFARAAELGGAAAVRIRDAANVRAVRQSVNLPIIGLTKSVYPDGSVLITPTLDEAVNLFEEGADIVAVDGSDRARKGYDSGAEFIREVKASGVHLVMADIESSGSAIVAQEAGADMVATTLHGYTPDTQGSSTGPAFKLIRQLVKECSIPVIAEGRIWTPEEARMALEAGAWAVVVGTAITRPICIVKRFTKAMAQE